MNYWVFIVTDQQENGQNYSAREVFEQRMKDRFWGLDERTPNRNNVAPGDQIIFYLGNPEKSFGGTAVLKSASITPSPTERETLSHHTQKVYQFDYGVWLDQIKIWETPRFVPDLVDQLDFIENKQYWGAYFQGGVRGISEEDFREILYFDHSTEKTQIQLLDIANHQQFALEAHLEQFIYANWNQVNWEKNLKLYQVEQTDGRQFPAGIWSIDFLAVDQSTNEFVVIELKRGCSSDQVVGQILRYIGWVRENLAEQGQNVHGIIICHESDEALRLAVSQIPNVYVLFYEVDFRLRKMP